MSFSGAEPRSRTAKLLGVCSSFYCSSKQLYCNFEKYKDENFAKQIFKIIIPFDPPMNEFLFLHILWLLSVFDLLIFIWRVSCFLVKSCSFLFIYWSFSFLFQRIALFLIFCLGFCFFSCIIFRSLFTFGVLILCWLCGLKITSLAQRGDSRPHTQLESNLAPNLIS